MHNIYSIQVQLTRKCNQHCYMCRKYTWPQKEIDIFMLKKIFEKHPKATYTFSGGEPLEYTKLDELNNLLYEYNISYQVLTNLNYKLSSEQFAFLMNADCIQVSFDGADEKTYNNVRNPIENGFKVVTNNIDRLLENDKVIKLNVTISKRNYMNVYDIINFVYREYYGMGEIYLRFFPVHTHDDIKLNHEMEQKINEQLELALKDFGPTFMKNVIFVANMHRQEYIGKCFVKQHHLVIDEDGIEYPCCRAINDNGFDVEQKYSISHLENIEDENVLYDFCKECDRYRKFNENWKKIEIKVNNGEKVYL